MNYFKKQKEREKEREKGDDSVNNCGRHSDGAF